MKHGQARRGRKSSEYLIWVSMHQRCSNPKNKCYADYGARGIAVCERWNDFFLFVTDMGQRPPGHWIDRVKNDGNYEPSNCKWATPQQQASNTRRNVLVTVKGETMTLKAATDKFGGRYGTVLARIHRGVPADQALGLS